MIVAGVGTRKGVEVSEVVGLIERALAEAHIDGTLLSAIATVQEKADEAGLVGAARQLGVELRAIASEAMQATGQSGATQSSCSQRLFGVASVSEAAALAAAGAGSELVLPRIKSSRATCALARGSGS